MVNLSKQDRDERTGKSGGNVYGLDVYLGAPFEICAPKWTEI